MSDFYYCYYLKIISHISCVECGLASNFVFSFIEFNFSGLLNMLSKMDKKDLEKGLEQANKILNSKNKDEIINKLKNQNNQ